MAAFAGHATGSPDRCGQRSHMAGITGCERHVLGAVGVIQVNAAVAVGGGE